MLVTVTSNPAVEPAKVLVEVGGVHCHEIMLRQMVYEDVVDGAAVGVAQQRVARLPLSQQGYVAGGDVLQKFQRVRAFHNDLAHVVDVEQPGVAAHGGVLFQRAAVLDGHLPSGKGHHARAQRDVGFVQLCSVHRFASFRNRCVSDDQPEYRLPDHKRQVCPSIIIAAGRSGSDECHNRRIADSRWLMVCLSQ
jgi:hypothetical protein